MRNKRLIILSLTQLLCYCTQNVPSIAIGEQIWMARNLNVDHFANGDPIPHARTAEAWRQAAENRTPAWCYFKGDSLQDMAYGKLYNWYAVTDARKLAPRGWHVPSLWEWNYLSSKFSGVTSVIEPFKKTFSYPTPSERMQIKGDAIGLRSHKGNFFESGQEWLWWSSSPAEHAGEAVFGLVSPDCHVATGDFGHKGTGYPVRCVKN